MTEKPITNCPHCNKCLNRLIKYFTEKSDLLWEEGDCLNSAALSVAINEIYKYRGQSGIVHTKVKREVKTKC